MEEVKKKHVQDIVDAHSDDKMTVNISDGEGETICPKCGGRLVLRMSKSGAYAGSQFWGCSNYPKCRYIKNM